MSDPIINKKCVIGLPACGYGFETSRMCFIARPRDGEFQLEEDILTQLLTERNYETYVALQKIDPGKLAFCTKICSKIITSHFCIVLLNASAHETAKQVKIPNSNVHFEYGMMLSFHKHVIPMQREEETLAFNVYPIDTVKYRPENFKPKAEAAIDDAILRFTTQEPQGRPIGSASDVHKYFAFRGLRYSNTNENVANALFALGSTLGFNLFDGLDGIVFFGYFHELESREIVVRVRFLMNNIETAYRKISEFGDEGQRVQVQKALDQLSIEVLVPEEAEVARIAAKIEEFQRSSRHLPVKVIRPSDVETIVRAEYEKVKL